MPFRDCSSDGVICSRVLEHLDNPITGVKEINRILTTDGEAHIAFPKPKFATSQKNVVNRVHLKHIIFTSFFTPNGFREVARASIYEQERHSDIFQKSIISENLLTI